MLSIVNENLLGVDHELGFELECGYRREQAGHWVSHMEFMALERQA